MNDAGVKSFISETEIEARKQKRQEEWEKVRKPEDPLEVPEEEYDPRSLFDRLQEQKDLRQTELEESRRLKNLIKGLDDDEVAFLELVDQTKVEMESKLYQEEEKELKEFRRAVSSLTADEQEAKLQHMRKTLNLQNPGAAKKSQQTLLAGALKRKMSESSESPEKKLCTKDEENSAVEQTPKIAQVANGIPRNGIHCLGILPGLGAYTDSSDSENSSNSGEEKDNEFDLVGRRPRQHPHERS